MKGPERGRLLTTRARGGASRERPPGGCRGAPPPPPFFPPPPARPNDEGAVVDAPDVAHLAPHDAAQGGRDARLPHRHAVDLAQAVELDLVRTRHAASLDRARIGRQTIAPRAVCAGAPSTPRCVSGPGPGPHRDRP